MMRVCKNGMPMSPCFRCDKATIFADDNYTIYGHAKTDWFRANPLESDGNFGKGEDARVQNQEFRTANLRQLFQPLILCRNQGKSLFLPAAEL